jgi:hypothetical protein
LVEDAKTFTGFSSGVIIDEGIINALPSATDIPFFYYLDGWYKGDVNNSTIYYKLADGTVTTKGVINTITKSGTTYTGTLV